MPDRVPAREGVTMKSFLRILGIFCAFLGVMAMGIALSAVCFPTEATPGWFIALTCVLAISVTVPLLIHAAKKEPSHRRGRAQPRPLFSGRFTHAGGLNLPPDTPCTVSYFPDRLVIYAMGQDFTLGHSRIVSVSTRTAADIQKQYVSSAGGAVAGAMMLGPLGALIGGRTKAKYTRTETRFLIFAYRGKDDGKELDYIILEYSPFNLSVRRFLRAYREQNAGPAIHIDL